MMHFSMYLATIQKQGITETIIYNILHKIKNVENVKSYSKEIRLFFY